MIPEKDHIRKVLQIARSYNDRKARLIGIPLVTLLITAICMSLVKEKHLLYFLYFLVANFFSTLVYWQGCRLISIYLRVRYPRLQEVQQRVVWGVIATLVYCILIPLAEQPLSMLATQMLDLPPMIVSFWKYLVVGISVTMVITAIYESVYFFELWKASTLEAERLKLTQLQTELDSLKNQVNPHFLFNNLNTLSSLIPRDPALAVQFVSQFSRVYRYVLEISAHTLIALEDELAFLESYTFLLQTRHGERLHMEVEIDPARLRDMVLPLSLQLLVENAVKHNIISTRKPLHIRVFTSGQELVVENILQPKLHTTPGTGLGINNIRSRYQLIAGKEIQVFSDENIFRVTLPLLPSQPEFSLPLSLHTSP
ncbi:MAG: hypothetical protein EAZ89_01020 [Bacteroidetes bacterium]|nr:MAG: hypothetical protein EAZ89_01020 [Bacteroidota bacterium]